MVKISSINDSLEISPGASLGPRQAASNLCAALDDWGTISSKASTRAKGHDPNVMPRWQSISPSRNRILSSLLESPDFSAPYKTL